ncbi:MAG: glutathione S-transferase [Motiliproteus sp.]
MPILYSLQNCPYAMRARLAILLAQQTVSIRAVDLKNKPAELLVASPKGTVPVLVLDPDVDLAKPPVIDESLEIMLWALQRNDPEDLLYAHTPAALTEMLAIIAENDNDFKPRLERYKHAKRFHDDTQERYRLECEPFVQRLEQRLARHTFFMGSTPSLLDYALLPFIRQFSRVNRQLYLRGPYSHLERWLKQHLQSRLFSKAMTQYPLWSDDREPAAIFK